MADLILEIIEGAGAGRQVELADPVEVGRDPSLALAVDDDQASRRHARISLQAGRATVEDLGSTNGTYVNDQPIAAARVLEPDDRVRVGGTVIQVRTAQQVSDQRTVARPVPAVTAVGGEVLQPASPEELEPPPAVVAAGAPRVAGENTPAFVPPELVDSAQARSDFDAIARLVDPRVKRQTNIAVIALIGAAGLLVLLAFGLK